MPCKLGTRKHGMYTYAAYKRTALHERQVPAKQRKRQHLLSGVSLELETPEQTSSMPKEQIMPTLRECMQPRKIAHHKSRSLVQTRESAHLIYCRHLNQRNRGTDACDRAKKCPSTPANAQRPALTTGRALLCENSQRQRIVGKGWERLLASTLPMLLVT